MRTFAPLVYPHKPGMAAWLNDWVLDFAARTPGAVPTATFYPEPGVADYVAKALAAGAPVREGRTCRSAAYDPRAPQLDAAWGLLAEAGVPVVVHCGTGRCPASSPGSTCSPQVLARHPRLVAVLAHAGAPDYAEALDLVDAVPAGAPRHDDGRRRRSTAPTSRLPPDWAARLADVADRVALGTDFPNIPYDYAVQIEAIASWAAADDRLGDGFLAGCAARHPAAACSLLGEHAAETS